MGDLGSVALRLGAIDQVCFYEVIDDLGTLVMHPDPGSLDTRMIGKRQTTVDQKPDFHIDFAKYWLNECRTRHSFCCSSPFNHGPGIEMPTRLVDLGTQDETVPIVRLVEPNNYPLIQAPYTALSYCWGKSSQTATCLTPTNIEGFRTRIVEENLPKTHRDAFRVARSLGFRYVWIDALCIVQGDAEDWERESRNMANVYGNATLTIVAGRAADCSEGFLGNRFRPEAAPVSVRPNRPCEKTGGRENDEVTGSMWLSLQRPISIGPVGVRGWCFQESLLSPRKLVFGIDGLTYECQEGREDDDGISSPSFSHPAVIAVHDSSDSESCDSQGPASVASEEDSATIKSSLDTVSSVEKEEMETARRWLHFWTISLLPDYTGRYTTKEDDVFAALSGVVQAMKPLVRGSRYLAGLWEIDMVRGLLWETHLACERRVIATPNTPTAVDGDLESDDDDDANRIQTQGRETQPPSWSWASLKGITYPAGGGIAAFKHGQQNWMVTPKYPGRRWTSHKICHAAELRIKECELEFWGRVCRVSWVPHFNPRK
ncbi:heterokaryon incompatibility protein-domain-containing protein [Astrocystis sublimbata]|nr:heterokaryon incompatibility protein-domain-containing protein [Astrocystis sublimbata]